MLVVVILQVPKAGQRQKQDADAAGDRSGDAVADVSTEALDRLDRFLLRVGDEKLPQVGQHLGNRFLLFRHLTPRSIADRTWAAHCLGHDRSARKRSNARSSPSQSMVKR